MDAPLSNRIVTAPNVVTLVRLGLVPLFLVLLLRGRPEWALACFAFAAVSDGIDGLLARLLNQRSKLGALLDPIADKVLVFSALLTLVLQGRLPLWLLCLVLFRDGCMVVGAVMVKWKRLEIPASPSRIGKYATFTMTVLVVLALASESRYAPLGLWSYAAVVGWVAALCVVVSTLQYFARFGYLFFVPARSS